MADVLVVADPGSGSSGRALGSALAFAERIHRQAPGTTALLLLGHQIHELAESAAYSGVDRVLVADHPALADVAAEGLTATVAADFSVTVGAATSFGKDLLPRVAARLDAGYVADCGDVSGDDGALVYRRAIFAGNAWERCRVETTHAVVSVRSSEVPPLERPRADTPAPIEAAAYVPAGAARGRIEVLGFEPTRGDRPDLTEARAVVAGGRMLQERFFELLEPLADELGAAIGATRAA